VRKKKISILERGITLKSNDVQSLAMRIPDFEELWNKPFGRDRRDEACNLGRIRYPRVEITYFVALVARKFFIFHIDEKPVVPNLSGLLSYEGKCAAVFDQAFDTITNYYSPIRWYSISFDFCVGYQDFFNNHFMQILKIASSSKGINDTAAVDEMLRAIYSYIHGVYVASYMPAATSEVIEKNKDEYGKFLSAAKAHYYVKHPEEFIERINGLLQAEAYETIMEEAGPPEYASLCFKLSYSIQLQFALAKAAKKLGDEFTLERCMDRFCGMSVNSEMLFSQDELETIEALLDKPVEEWFEWKRENLKVLFKEKIKGLRM
jgi:hypothetical protein